MDSDTEEQQQGRMENPLTNFLVIKELLRHDKSPAAILRNRLVHKLWLEVSTENWNRLKKRLVLRYSDTPEMEHGSSSAHQIIQSTHKRATLSEFYSLYQTGNPTVVRMVDGNTVLKMILHSWEFLEESNEQGNHSAGIDLNRWFWNWAGTETGWLRRLTLVDTEFRREVWVFKEYFLRKLPNLLELTVKSCTVHQNAAKDINQDYQNWLEYEVRKTWAENRRKYRIEGCHASESYRLLATRNSTYQHGQLNELDISLRVAEDFDKTGTHSRRFSSPLLVLGPLLAMLPRLERLSIGNYCEDKETLPLKPMEWDNAKTNGGAVNADCPEIGDPSYLGNFWELFEDEVIGQVENSMSFLNLLDFSGKAQQYGVFSTCKAACEQWIDLLRPLRGPHGIIYRCSMVEVALDIGMDPLFAQRDISILMRWAPFETHGFKMYRAPFEKQFPEDTHLSPYITELHFWGNIGPNLDFLGVCAHLHILCWTTSCFDLEYRGQRVYHLLKEGRKAYPLFREDLVQKTDWSKFPENGFPNMDQLEMDWGPMSLESWRQLHKVMPHLTWLKGVIHGDEQLAEITKLWPGLTSLEMAHGSRVTAAELKQHLSKLNKLWKFKWVECACTSKLFQMEENAFLLQEVVAQLRKQFHRLGVIELPWSFGFDGKVRSIHNICIQAEFETALLTGNSTRFFESLTLLGHKHNG